MKRIARIIMMFSSLMTLSTSTRFSNVRRPSIRSAFTLLTHHRSILTSRTHLCRPRQSVSGEIYTAADGDAPVVKLFTKEGCTLCDKVKDVLEKCNNTDQPHTLLAVDITDEDKSDWWSRYKYDIPVLHMNDQYWTKHKLQESEAIEALQAARGGTFVSPKFGEPNALKYESKKSKGDTE